MLPFLAIAGIGAGIGALAGGISTKLQGDKQRKQLERQRDAALARSMEAERQAKNAFGRAKAEANANAAKADRNLERQAGQLEDAYDRLSGDYNLSMAARGLEAQAARTGMEQNAGSAYSALGYSGVRGGSSNYAAAAANEDLYQQQFASSLELQANADESALRQTLQSYDDSFYGIAEGARETSALRASFEEGGLQKAAFNDQLKSFSFEQNMIRSDAEAALDAARPGVLDYATGIFSGASQGLSMASSWMNAASFANPGGGKKTA
ncbi:MAG: hypothetical protein LBP37_05055 [Spirochaetaceae bacterium]|jgi:hypothetical protein|nr:hypothetical protein [Spirochaetaceae bacterium]